MRKLPEGLRDELRKPLGAVLTGEELAEVMRTANILVTVGDVVTCTALGLGVVPHIAIVDGKTRRNDAVEIKQGLWDREVWVCNPPEHIANITIGVLERAFNAVQRGQKTFIFVEGEEDLLSLSCITTAPQGTTVIYGLPDVGAAVVPVDPVSKEKAKKIIDQMEMI